MSDTSAMPVLPPLRDDKDRITAAFLSLTTKAVERGDTEQLKLLVEDLHEADLADLIEVLDADERTRLISLLGRDFDFTALTEVDDAVREEILDDLPNQTIAEGVRDLDSDDAVYILEDLAEEDQEEVLANLPALERIALERSLDYPEDSAGRLMQADFISIPNFWTVGQTIDFFRDTEDLPDKFYELFIVDPSHALIGTLPLDRLLRAKRPVNVESLIDEVEHRIHAKDEASEAALLFSRYNLVSAPVLDEGDRLVGVLTIDDVVDVISDEADADIKALGGVNEDEEISDSIWQTAKSRFGWLFINLITAFIASSVLGMFVGQLEKMVALAVLVPIVASQGGNAATQTMTVAVRALATRELNTANVWRVVRREGTVGLINGAAFGILTGIVAGAWFQEIGVGVGVVICLAMLTNLIAGALGGILIPVVLNRFKFDPAVSSGAFVTTVTDVVGNFSFLAFATLWFRL